MSRRVHNLLRLFLSGTAALFAYTVVITSKPAVPPAAAAPDRPRPARHLDTAVDSGWSRVRPAAAVVDPRQHLFRFRR